MARLCLVIVAVLGLGMPQVTVALQRTQSDHRSSRTFQELFQQYLHGDAEGAVLAFAAWDDERIKREAQLLQGAAGEPLKPALAVFHSEALLRQEPGSGAHHKAAVTLMIEEICPAAPSAGDRSILALCRDWYPVMLRYRNVLDARDFLPGSASIQLARGTWQEWMSGPALDSGGGADHGFLAREFGQQYIVTSHGRFGPIIADAESSFRRALKIDPQLAEARARLGRVLFLLDRRDEARKELEQAMTDAARIGETFGGYLAAMFLGRLHEADDRIDDAILAYRRAAAAGPRFPAARVALARLLAATGRVDVAASTMTEFFRGLAPSGTSEIDPWTVYPRGRAFWHGDQILRALREAVRRNAQGVAGDVAGTDRGRPVLEVKPQRSEVLDKRMPQIVRRARSAEGLRVVLVLDTSASVTAGRREYPRRWHETPENFNQLVAAARSVVSSLRSGDEVSVITFSERLRLAVPPTTDMKQIDEALQPERLAPASAQIRSTVWDAAVAAAALAARRPERSVVILLTDGTDNASWLSQSEAITTVQRAGVAVDLILVPRTYDTLDEDPPGSWDVEAISERTGGEAFSAGDRDLSRKVADRLARLRQQR